MKHLRTASSAEFQTLVTTPLAQAALMTLRPGDRSDEHPSNEHPRCEQWLFVLSGTGSATTIGPRKTRRTARISAGSLVVIERRERHQIKNTGTTLLRTLNLYVPPAYDRRGNPRPSAG
jgi:oxalate decarboxylase/phosphoglucose isomerase-like protein (cupin superfamily)